MLKTSLVFLATMFSPVAHATVGQKGDLNIKIAPIVWQTNPISSKWWEITGKLTHTV